MDGAKQGKNNQFLTTCYRSFIYISQNETGRRATRPVIETGTRYNNIELAMDTTHDHVRTGVLYLKNFIGVDVEDWSLPDTRLPVEPVLSLDTAHSWPTSNS